MGKGKGGPLTPTISAAAVDCAYAAIDVFEGMMEARFIKYLGEDLERPFDAEGSMTIFRSLMIALQLVVVVLSKNIKNEAVVVGNGAEDSIPPLAPHEKFFTLVDEEGRESTTSKQYDPLQYLLTVLYLLSHTAVQTDMTCFWWDSEKVIEELWSAANLKILLQAIECAMDRVSF